MIKSMAVARKTVNSLTKRQFKKRKFIQYSAFHIPSSILKSSLLPYLRLERRDIMDYKVTFDYIVLVNNKVVKFMNELLFMTNQCNQHVLKRICIYC